MTLISVQQGSQSTQVVGFVGKTAAVDGSTATVVNGSATWELNVPANSNVNISISSSNGQTAYSGTYSATAGNNQAFTWDGKGNDGTQWPDGNYTMSVTGTDSSGNPVAISTQVLGVISSVDLTQSPPLLSINGQNYTVSQIRSIVG